MSAPSRRSRALTRTRSILSSAIAVLPHAVPAPRLVGAAGRLPPHRSLPRAVVRVIEAIVSGGAIDLGRLWG
jgi:hypothetical protein